MAYTLLHAGRKQVDVVVINVKCLSESLAFILFEISAWLNQFLQLSTHLNERVGWEFWGGGRSGCVTSTGWWSQSRIDISQCLCVFCVCDLRPSSRSAIKESVSGDQLSQEGQRSSTSSRTVQRGQSEDVPYSIKPQVLSTYIIPKIGIMQKNIVP